MYSFILGSNLVGQPTGLSDFLSPEECAKIIGFAESNLELKVGLTEGEVQKTNLRKSEVSWLGPDGEHAWLFNRVKDCINEVNKQWFGYQLIGFEGIQFTKYAFKAGREADFYSSHKDTHTLSGGTIMVVRVAITFEIVAVLIHQHWS